MVWQLLKELLCTIQKADAYTIEANIGVLRRLLPHRRRDELQEILEDVQATSVAQKLIGPPLYTRGAVHIYTLWLSAGNVLQLTWSATARRGESYIAVPKKIQQQLHKPAAEDADIQDYAESAYGDKLLWDRSDDIVQYFLTDTDTGELIDSAVCGIDAEWDVLMNLNLYPQAVSLEMSILSVIAGRIACDEFIGGRASVVMVICNNCGGTITTRQSVTRCDFCFKECPVSAYDITRRWRSVNYRHKGIALPASTKVCLGAGWYKNEMIKLPRMATCKHYSDWAKTFQSQSLPDIPLRDIDL